MVLNLDIKQTAPVVDALRGGPGRPAAPVRLRRPGDRGLVPRRRHRRLLRLRPRVRHLGRHAGHGRLLPGGPGRRASPAPMRHVALQVPATFGERHPGGRARSSRSPTTRAWPSTCGRSRRRPRWSACAASASTGSSPTGPRPWSGCSTGWAAPWVPGDGSSGRGRRARRAPGGCPAARRERPRTGHPVGRRDGAAVPRSRGARSAAPAVRLLAVVGLLLGPELALVGSFRHSSARLLAPGPAANGARRPAGRRSGGDLAAARRRRAGRRRGGRRLAASGPRACSGGTATTGPWCCPAPGRCTPSGCASPSTSPSATATWWCSTSPRVPPLADDPAPAAVAARSSRPRPGRSSGGACGPATGWSSADDRRPADADPADDPGDDDGGTATGTAGASPGVRRRPGGGGHPDRQPRRPVAPGGGGPGRRPTSSTARTPGTPASC